MAAVVHILPALVAPNDEDTLLWREHILARRGRMDHPHRRHFAVGAGCDVDAQHAPVGIAQLHALLCDPLHAGLPLTRTFAVAQALDRARAAPFGPLAVVTYDDAIGAVVRLAAHRQPQLRVVHHAHPRPTSLGRIAARALDAWVTADAAPSSSLAVNVPAELPSDVATWASADDAAGQSTSGVALLTRGNAAGPANATEAAIANAIAARGPVVWTTRHGVGLQQALQVCDALFDLRQDAAICSTNTAAFRLGLRVVSADASLSQRMEGLGPAPQTIDQLSNVAAWVQAATQKRGRKKRSTQLKRHTSAFIDKRYNDIFDALLGPIVDDDMRRRHRVRRRAP